MKNQNNRPFYTIKKKALAITGSLPLPLCVGGRAWIQAGGQAIITSTVECILEVSSCGVKFETRNTIYSIQYAAEADEACKHKSEVMCA